MRTKGRLVLVGLLLLLAVDFGAVRTSARPAAHQAGLVVQFDDDQVQTFCVNFDSETISGLQLLQSVPSLQVIYDATSAGLGAGVCKINATGCNFPLEDCFCQCQGLSCLYWSYWHLRPNLTWEYSQLGASSFDLRDGQVDGWRWGAGTTTHAQEPPVIPLSEICQPPPTATPTPSPTPTPSLTPTPTPTPSVTPTPTVTQAAPTATPVVQVVFEATPLTVPAGQCSTVRWRVEGPWMAIYFQGAIVTAQEERQVCPQQAQTLELRVEHGGGVTTRTLNLQVTGTVATVTPTPTAAATVTPTPTAAATVTPTPTAAAMTPWPTVTAPVAASATPTSPASPTAAVPTPVASAEAGAANAASGPTPTLSAPAAIQVTASPTAAPASQATGLWAQYALFGLMLLALGGAIVFALARQRGQEDA